METPHRQQDGIAAAVAAELHRRGFTTTFLADLSGVHRSTISRWLCGRRGVSTTTAAKVLDALELRIVAGDTTDARGR